MVARPVVLICILCFANLDVAMMPPTLASSSSVPRDNHNIMGPGPALCLWDDDVYMCFEMTAAAAESPSTAAGGEERERRSWLDCEQWNWEEEEKGCCCFYCTEHAQKEGMSKIKNESFRSDGKRFNMCGTKNMFRLLLTYTMFCGFLSHTLFFLAHTNNLSRKLRGETEPREICILTKKPPSRESD